MLALSQHCVVVQDDLPDMSRWLVFRDPATLVTTHNLSDVMRCLKEVESLTAQGLYAAGFISYEASAAMDGALVTHLSKGIPLIWFGLYDRYEALTLPEPDSRLFKLGTWQPSVSLSEYRESIAKVKQSIRMGDTYQVNYTMRLRNSFSGDPWALFLALYQAQRSRYSAYVNLGRYHVCSVSPELFFSLRGGQLLCKPMKGTAKRGCTTSEDRQSEQWLASSQKNRAENVMIVDMIRNDMGRIAKTGSVRVDELFRVERYPTVLQMTSSVTSQIAAPMSAIFRTMFPCASITGAPKIKTMQIIRQLEPDPRGIYTGAIGYISPDGDSQFNVAIRTAVVDMNEQTVEYGVGSGIVWDSDADDEYQECHTKANVLFRQFPEFGLIETILWTPEEGFYLLEHHLQRLQDSATYFQFRWPKDELRGTLLNRGLEKKRRKQRVRIILSRDGTYTVKVSPIASIGGATVGLSRRALSCHSLFLNHKTTYRKHYSDLLDEHLVHQPGLSDVIAWNEAGCVTESGIANVVIDSDGELLTPPLEQGLLPGIFRQFLLQRGDLRERPILVDDLLNARAVFLINSVRGWMPLDRAAANDTWVIRSDLNYEYPAR